MSTEAEQQAREVGWVPKDEFRGDQTKWKDAETYLKDGDTIFRFMRADRRKLLGTVNSLQEKLSQQQQIIQANQESIEELKSVTTSQRVEQLQAEVKELRVQLNEARRTGDDNKVADLEERLDTKRDEVKEAQRTSTREPTRSTGNGNGSVTPSGDQPQSFVNGPEFQSFLRDNPWFQEDEVMAGAAVALMKRKVQDPEFRAKSPTQRFALVAQEIRQRFGMEDNSTSRQPDRVEGGSRNEGGGRGGGGSGGPRKPRYEDLPAEARAACDKQAQRIKFGPKESGRAFANIDEWRAHYAAMIAE